MNSKTKKLIRKLAELNPYACEGYNGETRYVKKGSTIMLAEGQRISEKEIKKRYKRGEYTTEDIRTLIALYSNG